MESCVSNVLPQYTKRHPGVQVKLFEMAGAENLAMLERGEIHLSQNLSHAVAPDDHRFGRHPVGSLELLAAFQAGKSGDIQTIDIEHLAAHPLLMLDSGFSVRRTFDAACRLAGVKPNVSYESRAPHTLLALASAGHGVAIIPSSLRTEPYDLQIVRVTYRRQPVRESVVMLWDKRRSLPNYAIPFCEMCAAYLRQSLPIKKP
jgi:DNA-binding transcriptional LysR family regulator